MGILAVNNLFLWILGQRLTTHFLVAMQTDPGELFGWIESVFVQLGVWSYIQMFVALSIIIGGVRVFQRIFDR